MIQSVLEPITILTSNTSAVTFIDDDVRTRKANCCGTFTGYNSCGNY